MRSLWQAKRGYASDLKTRRAGTRESRHEGLAGGWPGKPTLSAATHVQLEISDRVAENFQPKKRRQA